MTQYTGAAVTPGPSLALASTLLHHSSFCATVSPIPCAEREILPTRVVSRLRDGYDTARESALSKELLRNKTMGKILWSTLTSLLMQPTVSLQKGYGQV